MHYIKGSTGCSPWYIVNLLIEFSFFAGCICTFSSPEDLAYIESSLKTSRLAVTEESKNDIYATLQPDMPVILLFARDLSVPESDLAQMKQDINTLAAM